MVIDLVTISRLGISAILSGLIGYEREWRGRAAGLRTHILVGLGSCLVVLTAESVATVYTNVDPTRLAAQVVSGIGFLGAGTIMRSRASVKGLTTAASLWVVACIGLSVGSGYISGAVVTTIISLLCLYSLSPLKRKSHR